MHFIDACVERLTKLWFFLMSIISGSFRVLIIFRTGRHVLMFGRNPEALCFR